MTCMIPCGGNGAELRGRARVQYSSHGSFASRGVQASPVWLVDHSCVELHPIIIKRCQSWSHILLSVSLITLPLLGSRQLLPVAGMLHCSLGTDNAHHSNNNNKKGELLQIYKHVIISCWAENWPWVYFSCHHHKDVKIVLKILGIYSTNTRYHHEKTWQRYVDWHLYCSLDILINFRQGHVTLQSFLDWGSCNFVSQPLQYWGLFSNLVPCPGIMRGLYL